MLVRLWSRALACVDDEQEEVDARCAGDHRADEALVSRNVHEREPAAVRQVERRVAQVDRNPARLFFRQPVGVLAGQRADEPRLAVVDVSRCPDRQRHLAWIRPSSISSTHEACTVEKRTPIRLGSLPAALEDEHQEVQPLHAVGSFPGGTTESRMSNRASSGAAARTVRRMAAAGSSSQSWRILDRTYASPSGTWSKKLPDTNAIRSP